MSGARPAPGSAMMRRVPDAPRSSAGGRWRWLPNALTLTRLAALPALLVVLIRADGPTSVPAAIIFGAVGATDFLDGILARRLGAESRFGRIVDPLADRLLVLIGLVGVIVLDRLHPAGPAILIAREVIVVAAYAWLLRRGIEMRVDMAGKVSSALAMVATGGAILLDQAWVDALFWVAVALAVATLLNYSREAAQALRMRKTVSTRP
jgi:CDP-diacylglycerol--glycerol-3-phosphate 3-phosphatidyltransferase